MSLTNPKNVITEERLAEFYQGILPYLGGMPDVLANKFSKSDLYSTDEKMIGRWIDGKPLYQKVVNTGALPSVATTKIVPHGINNIETVVSVEGITKNTNGTHTPLVWASTSAFSDTISTNCDSTNVNINVGKDRSAWTSSYVTIQYTKTTDSPVEIGIDTDYSTTEKIVGTWIDGKPLYQKVYHPSDISLAESDKHRTVDVEANFIPSKNLISCFGRYTYAYGTSAFECILGHQTLSDTSDAVVVTSAVYAKTSTNSLVFKFSQTNNTTVAKTLSDIYIVVQYTKTTD